MRGKARGYFLGFSVVIILLLSMNSQIFAEVYDEALQDRTQSRREKGTVVQSFGNEDSELEIEVYYPNAEDDEFRWFEVHINNKIVGVSDIETGYWRGGHYLDRDVGRRNYRINYSGKFPNGIYDIEIKMLRMNHSYGLDYKIWRKIQSDFVEYGRSENYHFLPLSVQAHQKKKIRSVQLMPDKTTHIKTEIQKGMVKEWINVNRIYTE